MVRVPVWTPQRVGPSLELIRRLFGPIRESRTYLRILYLLLALPLGVVEFSFLVTALSFGFGTAITLIGIPVLVGTVWAWRWLAQLERRIIGRLLGTEIQSPTGPTRRTRAGGSASPRASRTRPPGRTSPSCCSSFRSGS